MGAFLTNVQVRREPGITAARVQEVLVPLLAEDGWLLRPSSPSHPLSPGSTRGVRLLERPQCAWLSVYDESSEDQTGEHERLARELSLKLQVATVAVLVHDSDVLTLSLYQSGVRKDAYSSEPDYTAESKAVRGRADAWRGVLPEGTSPAQLEAAWRKREPLAEDLLARLAELIGFDEASACVGYEYFEELELEEDALVKALTFARGRPTRTRPHLRVV